MKVDYTKEDLLDHHAVAAVIRNDKGHVLMQDHIKYGFWTIPIGKAKAGQNPIDGVKEEVFEECNLVIDDLKEISYKELEYERDGILVKALLHVYEVLAYSGEMKNNEPHKHIEQKFMSVKEIMEMPYLSDCTVLFLKSLGFERGARLVLRDWQEGKIR